MSNDRTKLCNHPDNCKRIAFCKGYCQLHYQRLCKTGELGPVVSKKRLSGFIKQKCKTEGCERIEGNSRGLCDLHNNRLRFKGKIGPPEVIRFEEKAPDGYRTCRHKSCLKVKLLSEFALETKRGKKEYRASCKDCRLRQVRKQKYNLTDDQLDKLFENAKCQICLVTEKLVIDHCHYTGLVRGVLCSSCNAGIGALQDNIELVDNASKYLRTFESNL